jgi:hypothetical protein
MVAPVHTHNAFHALLLDVDHLAPGGDLQVLAYEATAFQSGEAKETNQAHIEPPCRLRCKWYANG